MGRFVRPLTLLVCAVLLTAGAVRPNTTKPLPGTTTSAATGGVQGGGVASPLTVAITSQCSEKSTGVKASPAYCHFHTTTTHTDADIDVFHHLKYVWNFGDSGSSGSGNWTYGRGQSMNAEYEPIAAHVYECASASCSYTVTVTVTDWQGNTANDTDSITVVGEDSAWVPASSTVCVSTSGTFTSCPSGATNTTSSDFDATMQTGAGKRTLYRCGETFAASASPTISSGASDGSLVGGFGSCTGNPALVTWALDSNLIDSGNLSGWRFRDIEFDVTNAIDGADLEPAVISNLTSGAQTSDLLILRSNFVGVTVCPTATRAFTKDIADGYNERVAFVDVYCKGVDTSGAGWPGGIQSSRYGAFLGYRFRSEITSAGGPAGMRMEGNDSLLWAHGSFEIASGTNAGEWSWRSCAGADTGTGGCDRPDQMNVIYDNDIWDDGVGAQRTVQFYNSHDISAPAASGVFKGDYILDGNFIHYGSTNTRATVTALRIDGCEQCTIRNNIGDFRRPAGAPSSGSDSFVVQSANCSGGTASCGPDTDWWIYNNTIIENSTGSHTLAVVNASPSGSAYALSNLAYDAGKASGITLCTGSWTVCSTGGGNVALYQTNTPFNTLSSPSYGIDPLEFDLYASALGYSSANDDGYNYAGGDAAGWSFLDFTAAVRTEPMSVGAFKD